MVSGNFVATTKIETGPGMLYMVEKVFLYGISFNIVCNESGHNKYEHFKTLFPHKVQRKILFLKQRWRSINQHICFNKYAPSNSDY